jgi:lipid II:glycine glycyltransferase (peptidoglycan interpeptide bridge formation enzyme)
MKADNIIRSVQIAEKRNWNAIANHPLQSWEWGEFREKMGIKVNRLGVYNKDNLNQVWQFTYHKIPYIPYYIGYFPKGPTPTDLMIEELSKIGRKNKVIYIQLEPDVIYDINSTVENNKFLIRSHHPLFTKYTFILDLTKTEDQMLAAMHPKTRYNIKVAQKHNVIVEENNSNESFQEYLELADETTKRQQFFAHNKKYQTTMWEIMSKSGIAKLWTAKINNEILAAWILFFWKDTVYYPYGASSRNKRDVMAPNLLLFEIAKYAKAQGFKKFDLWGAMGPNPDLNDPWYGFHRFKQGYNPDLIEFTGSFDLVINPLLYKTYCLVDDVRWKVLNLKK